jgi:hypothetical protein
MQYHKNGVEENSFPANAPLVMQQDGHEPGTHPTPLSKVSPAMQYKQKDANLRGTPPLVVNRLGQFPVVTLFFNLAPGTALGEAIPLVAEAACRLGAYGRAARP